MTGPLRPTAAAVVAAWAYAATMTPWALTAAVWALWAVADDHLAQRTGWAVYRLLDADGVTLYVGSTNDIDRRQREHLEEPDPWRRGIVAIVVHRHCHSEAQARRCERRLIGSMTLASRQFLCRPLHNQVWTRPGPWAQAWLVVHRLQAACWARCAWRGGSSAVAVATTVQRRRRPVAAGFLGHAERPNLVPTLSQPAPSPPMGAPTGGDSVGPVDTIAARVCRGCGAGGAARPGPRCVPCHRAYERTRKAARRAVTT